MESSKLWIDMSRSERQRWVHNVQVLLGAADDERVGWGRWMVQEQLDRWPGGVYCPGELLAHRQLGRILKREVTPEEALSGLTIRDARTLECMRLLKYT